MSDTYGGGIPPVQGSAVDPNSDIPPVMGPPLSAAQQVVNALTVRQDGDTEKRISRETPQPEHSRAQLVKVWCDRIKADKKHFEKTFKRIRRNGDFVNGRQWQEDDGRAGGRDPGVRDERYVANIALRHVQQRTASLYASNPKVVAQKRERMLATIWDGDTATIQQAQQQMQQAVMAQAQQAQLTGIPVIPGTPPPGLSPNVMAVLADFNNVKAYEKMLKRVCKTLELLWDYNVEEQTFSFKAMMKKTVRRAVIGGVGYVKLGFQRAMVMRPDIESRIADMTERMSTIQQLSNDIADGELDPQSAEAEQLRLTIQALLLEPQVIVREGLTFDYPDTTSIIPDRKCRDLRAFLGADWVSQEYALTPDEIQKVYGVDVGRSYRGYTSPNENQSNNRRQQRDEDTTDGGCALVWETYCREDGLVYVTCDGYPDFLREPTAPDVYLDRFYPWFVEMLNETAHDDDIFPVSDIDLLRDMQLDLNRARQGLREHRRANRPKMVAAAGMLEDGDKEKLANHPANALIELAALQPGQKVEDVLMPLKMPPIDPVLYDTNQCFEDLLRVLGQDQASNGQTTSASATEVSVAQSSQHTDLSSCLDDQDDMLTEMAKAGGKLLLMNVSAATVQKIIGPGAIWPELSKEDIVTNIYLTIEAGSTGRPNKQQEVMNAQVLFPMLQRVPGISPEWMARELIKRMDDRLDLTEAFVEGLPSMDALNRIQGTVATPAPQDPTNTAPPPGPAPTPPAPPAPPPAPSPQPGGTGGGAPVAPPMGGAANDPTAQGSQGAQNAQVPPPTNGLLGPRTPPYPGLNGLPPGQGGGPKPTAQGNLPTP